MRSALAVLTLLLILAGGAAWWLKREGQPPQAALTSKLETLGRKTAVDIDLRSDAPGLRTVTVRLQAAGTIYELLNETYPAEGWRGSLLTEKHLHLEPDLSVLKVPEGPVTLEVFADTYAWHLWQRVEAPRLSVPLSVDLSPPLLSVLTTQHNLRLGGADLVIFRQSADTIASGVQVDKYFFPAVSGYFADQAVALALFAVPQDLDATAQPQVVARDAAGNQREVLLPCNIKTRQFAERTLAIDDSFLARKVPEIEQVNRLPASSEPVQGYLSINRDLRQRNEAQLREVTASSVPEPLWNGAFHRQSNAAPLSSFADRRTYTYRGEAIDHQTHLGFDLASLKLAAVEAAQNGIVVFAGNLGIYGNTVVLDHGLGVFSLYGHLSSLAVQLGQRVAAEQSLGQTGETGLAGGDHLHFSVMLHGVHVDPVEWWDGHWLRDHVTTRLAMFPRATAQKANQP
jgi:murein DD-endopeptidase MepM/ murein hydrolase activator NlpD